MLTIREEFASQEIVAAMKDDHAVFPIQFVYDLHVEIVAGGMVDCVFYACEFFGRGLNKHKLRAEVWLVQPVGTGYGDRTRGEEEEFVHMLEDGKIRVEGKNAV